MALTFETLRERNEKALRASEERLMIPSRRSYARRRIQELLAKSREIDALASPDDQIESYGIEAWHQDFVRLTEEQMKMLWPKIPNSRFKRVQELFCHSHQRIIPSEALTEEGDIRDMGKEYWNALPLLGCLVSADRIPDEFTASTGIATFEEEDRPYDRLKKKRGAVPALKKLLESTVHFDPRNHRWLAIEKPSREVEERYAGTPGPSPELLGTIIYTRTAPNGNGNGEKQIHHFTGAAPLYAAHRKTTHEHRGHDLEVGVVTGAEEDIAAARDLIGSRYGPDTRETLATHVQEVSDRVSQKLLFAVDSRKIRARTLVQESSTLTDRRGRPNPSAAMSKQTAAIGSLSRRTQEMHAIAGFNRKDQLTLEATVKRDEGILKKVRQGIENLAKKIEKESLFLFGNTKLTSRQQDVNIGGLFLTAQFDPSRLELVRIQPLRTYAEKLQALNADLDTAIRAQDRDATLRTLIQMHVIGKIQAMRTCIERVKEKVLDVSSVEVSAVHDFIGRLRKIFDERQIAPGITVTEYEVDFKALQGELATLEEGLAHYRSLDHNERIGARSEMFQRLRDYLDRFDHGEFHLEESVRRLP